MDTYECNVIFINEKIGEFQYTIEGKGELPEVQKVINQTCIVEEICEIGIDIEQQNKLFVDALNKIRFEHKLESKNSKKISAYTCLHQQRKKENTKSCHKSKGFLIF